MSNDGWIPLEDLHKHVENKPKSDKYISLKVMIGKIGKEAKSVGEFIGSTAKTASKSKGWAKTKKYLSGVQKNFEEQSKGSRSVEKSISPIIGGLESKKQREDIKFDFL